MDSQLVCYTLVGWIKNREKEALRNRKSKHAEAAD